MLHRLDRICLERSPTLWSSSPKRVSQYQAALVTSFILLAAHEEDHHTSRSSALSRECLKHSMLILTQTWALPRTGPQAMLVAKVLLNPSICSVLLVPLAHETELKAASLQPQRLHLLLVSLSHYFFSFYQMRKWNWSAPFALQKATLAAKSPKEGRFICLFFSIPPTSPPNLENKPFQSRPQLAERPELSAKLTYQGDGGPNGAPGTWAGSISTERLNLALQSLSSLPYLENKWKVGTQDTENHSESCMLTSPLNLTGTI